MLMWILWFAHAGAQTPPKDTLVGITEGQSFNPQGWVCPTPSNECVRPGEMAGFPGTIVARICKSRIVGVRFVIEIGYPQKYEAFPGWSSPWKRAENRDAAIAILEQPWQAVLKGLESVGFIAINNENGVLYLRHSDGRIRLLEPQVPFIVKPGYPRYSLGSGDAMVGMVLSTLGGISGDCVNTSGL